MPTNEHLICIAIVKGTSRVNLDKILEHTGYKKATDNSEVDFGKWFTCNGDEDDNRRRCPDFVSKTSYQRIMQGDMLGWNPIKKDNYPDINLWCHLISYIDTCLRASSRALNPCIIYCCFNIL